MLNTNLLTLRNILIIAAFAVAWQLILSRVNGWLGTREAANADAA